MDDPAHSHQFRERMAIDHCHTTAHIEVCACGSHRTRVIERVFHSDPLQIAFARQDCERCRELTMGMEPDSWRTG